MRHLSLLFAVAGMLLAGNVAGDTFAITGARLYTMDAGVVLDDGSVVVEDGRIRGVGRRLDIPADVRRIDARGKIVTPAFMNSATQLGLTQVSSVDSTNDHAVTEGYLGASFDVRFALDPNSTPVVQARVDGLSRAISFPTGSANGPFSGRGVLLHLVTDDDIVERAGIAMFASVGGQTSVAVGGSRSAQWQLLRNALEEAAAFRGSSRAGSPRDSAMNRLDLLSLKPVAEGRIPLVIAADRESDIRQAIALASDLRLSVIIQGGAEAWRVAGELAAADIPVVLDPSLNLPLYFDQLGIRADNAALLDRAGVLIGFHVSSIHTNFNAGFTLREVAGLAVANGLDYEASLAALTVNPARIWNIAEHYGTISVGKDADLIIWDGDPLEPLSTLEAVFVRGVQVPAKTRRTELRDRYHPGTADPELPPAYRQPSID